jgi:hypothetical protein
MEEVLFKPIKNINEIEKVQNMYSSDELMLQDINVDEHMNVTINESERMKATEDFFHSFYDVLGIPYPFTRKIPNDLLLTNIERLEQEYNMPVKIIRRGDILINIVKNVNRKGQPLFFQQINSSLLMDNFSSDTFELKNSYVGDYGLVIDVLHKNLGEIKTSKVGDTMGIGYRIKNPFTMFEDKMFMSLYLNQLSCENGMVMSKEFGGVSLNLTKDLGDEETFLQRFRTNIDMNINKTFSLEKITEVYLGMSKTLIKNRWLKPIMSNVRKIDDDLFTKVFSCNWDDEKELLQDSFINNETDDSDYNYFDVVYNITKEAQKESVMDRLFLEEYNSKIINLYKKQLLVTTNLN